jgi:excisionase family DNA binding protein
MEALEAPDEALRPKLYTVPQAAEYFGVSVSHMYDVIAAGKLAGVVRIGRTIRINLDAIVGNGGAG